MRGVVCTSNEAREAAPETDQRYKDMDFEVAADLIKKHFAYLVHKAGHALEPNGIENEDLVISAIYKTAERDLPEYPIAYLTAAVWNNATTVHRHREVVDRTDRLLAPIYTEFDTTYAEAMRLMTCKLVMDALVKTPKRYREVLFYRYLLGYTPEETATEMRISRGGVSSLAKKALKYLEVAIGEDPR